MSVGLTGGAYLTRTTNLPSITGSSLLAWVYFDVVNAFQSVIAFGDTASDFYYIGTDNTGRLELFYVWSAFYGSTLTTNTWTHLAMTLNGTGAGGFLGYLNGVLNVTGDARTITGSQIYLGSDFSAEHFAGRLASVKTYNAVLSAAEIQQEMRQMAPHRTANLNDFRPWLSASDVIDYSGNGNASSTTGTPTSQDGPPIPWRQGRQRLFYLPSGGGGGTIASGDGASHSQSTAVASGAAIASGTGRSSGGSGAYAVGSAIAAGNGAALSLSTARAPQSVIASGSGAAVSQSVATAPPAAIAAANAFSLGLSFATGTASSSTVATGTGVSLGLSHSFAVGSAIAAGSGLAVSQSVARGQGSSIAAGVGISRSDSRAWSSPLSVALGAGFSLSISLARGTTTAAVIVIPIGVRLSLVPDDGRLYLIPDDRATSLIPDASVLSLTPDA